MMRVSLLSLLALSACSGAYGRRVPDDVVERLPYESRIELLESENALAVALDRVDEANGEITRARDGLRRAKSRQEEAEDEVDRAEDDVSRGVAKLAVEESQARVIHLRARQHLNVEREEIEQLALRCAYARFELARLAAARKAKVEGSEKLEPSDFEKQAETCEARVKEARKELSEPEAEEQAARKTWNEKRAALSQKTFDGKASPFIEEL